MAYKTILAVLDTPQNARQISDFSISLARNFSAHLIGVHAETLAAVPLIAPMEIPDPAAVQVLQEAVQDYEYNITRFAIIGGVAPPEANKTTIVFALPSTPGALFKALSVFALRDINLTKLESRPMRGRPTSQPTD